jgi:DNA-binding IclR family transcriptional regulator
MVKPALAATRAARVLDFLALHPGQAFSLKEISAACGVNAASLLAVVTALTDAGYLLRHSRHKTYTLGPAVVLLAHAALVQHPVVEAAEHELEGLAHEVRTQCAASVLMGDTLVATAVAGKARRSATWNQTGTRVPFAAPFGAVFAAFGDDDVQQRWFENAHVDGPRRDAVLHVLEDVRRRSMSVVEERQARKQLGEMYRRLADEPGDETAKRTIGMLTGEIVDSLLDLRDVDGRNIEVASLSVPVFSPLGEVVMHLSTGGFGTTLTVEEIVAVGERMHAAAESISFSAFGVVGTPSAELRS